MEYVENAYEGYIEVNPDAVRKDAFVAGYKLAYVEIRNKFANSSIVDGVQYLNDKTKEMKV